VILLEQEIEMNRKDKSSKAISRSQFLSKAGLASFSALLGSKIVFGNYLPAGLLPVELEASSSNNGLAGKNATLMVLNDRPWNAETPVHLLDPPVTPTDVLFVRNNGLPPVTINESTWALTIEGESVKQKQRFTLHQLKTLFKTHHYQLTLECGGNGRSEFNPPAKGNQWGLGAVGCPKWTGARVKDVLAHVGIKEDAVYLGYYGADTHLSGDKSKTVISRGVPIQKALTNESLIAWAINDQPLPIMHGAPLRLVFGGWPASTSGKWLNRIVIRNKVHDGPKMGGMSYRIPKYPVAPGAVVPEEDMKIIEAMPVKSIITAPKTGAIVNSGRAIEFRGHAWVGDLHIGHVEVSIDFGASWKKASLQDAVNRNAWQQWKIQLSFPEKGYYEVWCKATDENGIAQPMVVPAWNPKGYLNNACHRIAVKRT
jgi:sulfite oxidase